MSRDPAAQGQGEDEASAAATDLFSKLDSLIQKHQRPGHRPQPDVVPMLTEPVESQTTPTSTEIPVLQDAIDEVIAAAQLSGPLAQARRQLQVALYLRLRQRLDQELEAALADNMRLGAVAVDPAFTRVAQELRAILPIVVRESVEQVLGPASFEALLSVTSRQGTSSS
jgi:hypothetical protein